MELPEIDHLEVWVSAQKPRKSSGRGASKAPGNAGLNSLRDLILRFALSGKLTDQLSSEVIESKTGGFPRQSSEGVPFDIPSNWAWIKLPDVANYKTGRTPSTKNSNYWAKNSEGIPWVSIADLNHKGFVHDTSKAVSLKAKTDVFRSDPVEAGTILMSFKLTVGKTSILQIDAFHNEAIIGVLPKTCIQKEFLFHLLPLMSQWGVTKDAIKGKTLNLKSIANISVPVPPLQEQKRIVTKVDELMALIDDLEAQTETARESHAELVDALLRTLVDSQDAQTLTQNWNNLAKHFDTLFTTEESVEKLKATILDLAVRGKLSKQLEHEVIESKTSFPRQSSKGVSFDIPSNWAWIKLPAVASYKTGRTPSTKNSNYWVKNSEGIPWVSIADLNHKGFVHDTSKAVSLKAKTDVFRSDPVEAGTILMSFKLTVGKTSILQIDAFHNEAIIGILPKTCIQKEFLFHLLPLMSQWGVTKDAIKGKTLNLKSIANISVPVPPLQEQKRIVAKVDELMSICDTLLDNIRTSEALKVELAENVVHYVSAS